MMILSDSEALCQCQDSFGSRSLRFDSTMPGPVKVFGKRKDKTIVCGKCGKSFVHTGRAQRKFDKVNYKDPVWCPTCRPGIRASKNARFMGKKGKAALAASQPAAKY